MFKRGSVTVLAAGLVLAVGGCGSGTDEKAAHASGKKSAEPAPARPPSKELVEWVGGMCESTSALKDLRAESAADLKEIRESGQSAQFLAVSYLSQTPTAVEDVESDLKGLDPSGVPAADRLLDAWLKKLKGVTAELDEVSPGDALDDAEGITAGVDKLVQSLTPPKPDLPALTKKDSQLAAAYKRAEQCAPGWKPGEEAEDTASPAPTGPLPKAADGKNTDACSDGECEVLVTSPGWITANGLDVHVIPGDDSVTFETPSSVMRLGGAGGVAKWGDDLKVTVVAQNKDGAVLKFTVP
ncbi:hypothetical protein [Streptomyces jeddahensis]|uniref:Uncharacterized protein n=1 Tax=Streptomyces jeddahensis TaxID=1716141 RepID=A0A177HX05_9ACTN|nr:hypothetical protein [Streptomyces jeddahensis]OAH15432.1 hypothetical protein STSP_12030 [Streptomyces jeddahensis]